MKIEISQHRQPLVRTAIYGLMTLSVIVIVSLLMLIVLGYSFNQKDGKLEQGGLLQFASTPTGARVTLDEVVMGPRTNTKATVDAGSHSVSFDRDGYRTWRKSITIAPGQIGWLSYARMVPQTITPNSLRTFPALAGSLASPHDNYILLHENADQPTFLLANVQGDDVKYTTLTLPEDTYTPPSAGKTQTFSAESWSVDEDAVLIKHIYDDNKTEWILLNRNDLQRSLNISATFAVDAKKLSFAGGGNRLLFVHTDDTVRRMNLDEETLSRPLATDVADFTPFDEKTITFATTADDKGQRTVGYAAVDIPTPQTIAVYPGDSQPLFIAMSSYFNRKYVSIVHGTDLKILTGTLPTPDQKIEMKQYTKQTLSAPAQDLLMSRNARFAVAQLPDGYATYDIELKKFDRTKWAVQPATQHPLRWLDDYMLWGDGGGMLRFYEFDGANQQNIMPVTEGFSASLSPNDKYVYGVLKTDKGFEFRRGLMILQ